MKEHKFKNLKITKEIARELYDYNPETGLFIYKPRGLKWFQSTNFRTASGCMNNFNSRFDGKLAFNTLHSEGYLEGSLFDNPYLAHRFSFIWMVGKFPKREVDHLNGNRKDNRWDNLRECDSLENNKNLSLSIRNTTGHIGVYKRKDKWYSQITVNYKTLGLGTFDNFEDAVDARKKAERVYGYSENHGREISR